MSNYPLRLPESLMDDARELARQEGVSINQLLSTLIAERIGEMKALKHVRARMARADPKAVAAILDLVPDRIPIAGDEMPEAKSKQG